MDLDSRPIDRLVRLDSGSALIEGLAAIGVVFILFTVLVQSTVLLVSHEVAGSIVTAAAHDAASGFTVPGSRLADDIRAVVPGAHRVEAEVSVVNGFAVARAALTILPPGPALGSVDFVVEAEVPVVTTP